MSEPAPAPASGGLLREPLVWLLVLLTAGLVVIRLGHTRLGLATIVASVGLAALLRLVLSPHRAGLLAVRTRAFDVLVMSALAVGLAVVLAVVPFHGR